MQTSTIPSEPRPSKCICMALATIICAARSMQPQPTSEVMSALSCMGINACRYEIHMRERMSRKHAAMCGALPRLTGIVTMHCGLTGSPGAVLYASNVASCCGTGCSGDGRISVAGSVCVRVKVLSTRSDCGWKDVTARGCDAIRGEACTTAGSAADGGAASSDENSK